MNSRAITLWIDERWYDTLSRYLQDETVEDKLNNDLDDPINKLLTDHVCSRISPQFSERFVPALREVNRGYERKQDKGSGSQAPHSRSQTPAVRTFFWSRAVGQSRRKKQISGSTLHRMPGFQGVSSVLLARFERRF